MIATSGFLTTLEWTKFALPRTPLGELTALPRPFKGDPTSKGKG